MSRKILLAIVFSALFTFTAAAQTVEYTKRSKNEAREGPGNYYKLLYIWPPGIPLSIMKKDNGWLNVNVNGNLKSSIGGWISKNCLLDKPPGKDWRNLQLIVTSSKVSPASIAAAIRGFALRFGRAPVGSVDSLIKTQTDLFTLDEYDTFKKESNLIPSPSLINRVSKYSHYFRGYDITSEEEGIGLGIAAKVAQRGMLSDIEIIKYLNLLTTLLSESSGAYDWSFKVLILGGPDLTAFSVPGGYIFITEGLLNLCENEAELAAVISHEMMHIILQHGLQEIQKRIMNLKMDQIMSELDLETGYASDELNQELDDFANESYDIVMKPRLQSYEEEADKGAVLLLIKTGYDPAAVPGMILKTKNAIKQQEDLEMENPFAGMNFNKRYEEALNFIKKGFNDAGGAKNKERFSEKIKR